jgi:hypothetical protein
MRMRIWTPGLFLVLAATGAHADQTSRMAQLLAGTDGTTGFYAKQVGGAVTGKLREGFQYDPASSIKIVVAVAVLKKVDAGLVNLDTTTAPYFPEGTPLGSSCPQNLGAPQNLSIGSLLRMMLVDSNNLATRTLVDFLGGVSAINQAAQSFGMPSTFMDGYPGCQRNRMTQLDAARLYEGLGAGTLVSASSRFALYARMPADGGDPGFPGSGDVTGTLWRARDIVEALAPGAHLDARQTAQFRAALDTRYKAGNGAACTSPTSCLFVWSIAGVAAIPVCKNGAPAISGLAWGVFINDATNGDNASNVFFNTIAEPLREPIAASLATWPGCSPACLLNTEVPGLPTWTVGRTYARNTQVQWLSKPYTCVQPSCVARAGSEPSQPGLTAIWQGANQCGIQAWEAGVAYPIGQIVYVPGADHYQPFRCLTAHLSTPSWRPDLTPTLWGPLQ